MPHILGMSEKHIANHLRLTGRTREELERFRAEGALPEGKTKWDESDFLEGCDPSLRDKFTMPIAFEVSE